MHKQIIHAYFGTDSGKCHLVVLSALQIKVAAVTWGLVVESPLGRMQISSLLPSSPIRLASPGDDVSDFYQSGHSDLKAMEVIFCGCCQVQPDRYAVCTRCPAADTTLASPLVATRSDSVHQLHCPRKHQSQG